MFDPTTIKEVTQGDSAQKKYTEIGTIPDSAINEDVELPKQNEL